MPDLMAVTNPVPGQDRGVAPNVNLPASPDNTQVRNVPDPSRVVRADGRGERQSSGEEAQPGQVRYDSNFQTFLQRLSAAPGMAQELSALLGGREGTVVLSGMSEGVAAELSQVMELLRMDEGTLKRFLTGQVQSSTRFSGPLFNLLRGAYDRGSDAVRSDILRFAKSYLDYMDTQHIEGSILRELGRMADAMPASWAEKLRELTAQVKNDITAGDRQGATALLQRSVIPLMSDYVDATNDMGLPRDLLRMMTLELTRYENGSQENLLEAFHQLSGYGALKNQLGKLDDDAVLHLLNANRWPEDSAANQFSAHLASAVSRALKGEGSAESQQIFKNLAAALIINESVYMPVNHYLIPLQWDGHMLFSEMWVDPDDEEKGKTSSKNGRHSSGVKILLKIDVQSLGFLDVILSCRDGSVDMKISGPDRVAACSKEIESAMGDILRRNGLTVSGVSVTKMKRPVALTEVFPKIFEGKNSVNVKV